MRRIREGNKTGAEWRLSAVRSLPTCCLQTRPCTRPDKTLQNLVCSNEVDLCKWPVGFDDGKLTFVFTSSCNGCTVSIRSHISQSLKLRWARAQSRRLLLSSRHLSLYFPVDRVCNMQTLSLQHISNVMWTYAIFLYLPSGMMSILVTEIKKRLNQETFNAQQLSNLLWSLCISQVGDFSAFIQEYWLLAKGRCVPSSLDLLGTDPKQANRLFMPSSNVRLFTTEHLSFTWAGSQWSLNWSQ